jgi:hypothetical protein
LRSLELQEVFMTNHRPCYGKLFPSKAWREPGKERPDAVFEYVFRQWGTVARRPEITVDIEAWDHCVECREFDSCRELSAAKMLLEMAVT